MPVIQVLGDLLANKIAAGEVIERPASVVKELVENSIDAGAYHVDVHVEESGLSLIRVVDDGCGMVEEDAVLSFERHATSKLQSDHDLFHIRTLGFRGEALPSIAAVSKAELRSRCRESFQDGISVIMEGGRLVSVGPVAVNEGTELIVRDLFFNTPARLKYMRSLQTELSHITEVVGKLALANPGMAFRLTAEDRTVLSTAGDGQLLQAFAAVYGASVARHTLLVDRTHADYRLGGLIGTPEITRANRSHCLFFVNGRSVRSQLLLSAVQDAYRTRLPERRYPYCALDLRLDPILVDVNVHPAKAEVRFSEEKDVYHFVRDSVSDRLSQAVIVPRVVSRGAKQSFPPSVDADDSIRGVQPSLFERTGEDANKSVKSDFATPSLDRNDSGAEQNPNRFAQRQGTNNLPIVRDSGHAYVKVANAENRPHPTDVERALEAMEPVENDHESVRPALRLRAIGQALGMYILAQDEETVYIIDQHAAHERILFETFSRQMADDRPTPITLLVPFTVELSAADAERMVMFLDDLTAVGIDMEKFGGSTYLARSVPAIWDGLPQQRLLQDTIDEMLKEQDADQTQDAVIRRVIMKACKAAVKANEWLSMAEMQALCDALTSLDNPYSCPHGRPVMIGMSARELAHQFKRT